MDKDRGQFTLIILVLGVLVTVIVLLEKSSSGGERLPFEGMFTNTPWDAPPR